MGDGRYSFSFVAELGNWCLTLSSRGNKLEPIDFTVVNPSPPTPLAPAGNLICTLGAQGKEAGEFNGPMGIAVHPNDQLIYIADCYNHRIQALRVVTGYDRRMMEAQSRRYGRRSSGDSDRSRADSSFSQAASEYSSYNSRATSMAGSQSTAGQSISVSRSPSLKSISRVSSRRSLASRATSYAPSEDGTSFVSDSQYQDDMMGDETDEEFYMIHEGDDEIEVSLECQYGVTNQPGNQVGYLYNPRGVAISEDGELLYVAGKPTF